jgi:hypothetical protein
MKRPDFGDILKIGKCSFSGVGISWVLQELKFPSTL